MALARDVVEVVEEEVGLCTCCEEMPSSATTYIMLIKAFARLGERERELEKEIER